MADDPQPAGQRTELAEDRTMLANERTFAGWLRTGLTAVGVGVGFSALVRAMEPPWVPRAIATTFLLLGAFIVIAAERRAAAVARKMTPMVVKPAGRLDLGLITVVTALATLALVAALWLAPIS